VDKEHVREAAGRAREGEKTDKEKRSHQDLNDQ
jgi:hypothetical protein